MAKVTRCTSVCLLATSLLGLPRPSRCNPPEARMHSRSNASPQRRLHPASIFAMTRCWHPTIALGYGRMPVAINMGLAVCASSNPLFFNTAFLASVTLPSPQSDRSCLSCSVSKGIVQASISASFRSFGTHSFVLALGLRRDNAIEGLGFFGLMRNILIRAFF